MGWLLLICDRRHNRGAAGQTSLMRIVWRSGRKKDSATASASILYDIVNDWIADAAIDPYPSAERKQAMGHILRLKELGIASQSLVLFDRGYPEAKFLAFLQTNGIHFLMRCKRKWNNVIDETQSNDFTLELKQGIALRAVRVLLPSGETEALITNLFDLPYEQFMRPLFLMRCSWRYSRRSSSALKIQKTRLP